MQLVSASRRTAWGYLFVSWVLSEPLAWISLVPRSFFVSDSRVQPKKYLIMKAFYYPIRQLKQFIVLIFFATFCIEGYSQISYTKDVNGISVFEVSINNIINAMEISSSEFKRSITSNGYNISTPINDCNSYVKGSSEQGTIHSMNKCGMHQFSIGWFAVKPGRSNISKFLDEIEPYYGGYDDHMQKSFYKVVRNNKNYFFYISRDKSTESVFCKKR